MAVLLFVTTDLSLRERLLKLKGKNLPVIDHFPGKGSGKSRFPRLWTIMEGPGL